MVGLEKSKQFEGFDFNDYAFIDTSANPYGANAVGIYVAGTNARLAMLSLLMMATPVPTVGGPVTSIGPQYAWPFHGGAGGPTAALPTNVAPVQKTLFRVVTNDVNVYLFDEKLANYLLAYLALNPDLAALGPTAGAWPMPVAVPLQVAVGLYEFERKWIWLMYQRAVADADGDLYVYMEG